MWTCCEFVVGFVGGLAHGGSRWLAVGLFRSGSGWFLVHRWCWVVGFGSPMGRDGLPGGLWWFFGWVAMVMVGRRCWVVGYGFVYCKQKKNNNNNK